MPVSIRSRLLLLMLSWVLPALLAGAWLVQTTVLSQHDADERTLRETTRALSLVVDVELAQRAAMARLLALSRALDRLPLLEPEDRIFFEQQARRATLGLEGWVELRSREQRLVSTRPGAMPRPAEAPGTVLADVPQVRPMQQQDGTPTHAEVSAPVRRGDATLGTVAVIVLPSELQRIVNARGLPPGWQATVLDSSHNVVARSPYDASAIGRRVDGELAQRLEVQPEDGFAATAADGTRQIGYYSTSSQGWTYVTVMPRAQFGGYTGNAVLRVGLGGLVLLAIGVAGALWVSRSIVRPVNSLQRAAAAMQSGQAVDIAPTGIAECDAVAAAMSDAAMTMQHARANLERQVAEAVQRTREAEQRVSQSQRVEALGRLTGGVAHDFNNLLGVISNSAHLMERHAGDDPKLKAPLAATLRAVDVGSRLTQHLMRFAGRRPVRPQAVDLSRYLPEVEELLKSVVGKRIAVEIAVEPGTQPVTVDSSELELALINLALNARDAMPQGGTLWLHASDAPQHVTQGLPSRRYVLITVRDNGSGIDDEVAERVFEPFFTTKSVGQGTGLGLSQVHGFCVQAGGTARLASASGVGTTISLLLPASSAAAAAADAQQPLASHAPPAAALHGTRLLLVEDNEELGDATAALLASYGCTIRRARGAAEALQQIEAGAEVDVVLSDIVMPGAMDGIGLARTLRERHPGLPLVLISGYSSAMAAAREFTVLQKPCAQDELIAALATATQRRRAATGG